MNKKVLSVLTQDCDRPVLTGWILKADKHPGVIQLEIIDVQSAVSVAAVADAQFIGSVKYAVDAVAVVNERQLSTAKRPVAPEESC